MRMGLNDDKRGGGRTERKTVWAPLSCLTGADMWGNGSMAKSMGTGRYIMRRGRLYIGVDGLMVSRLIRV